MRVTVGIYFDGRMSKDGEFYVKYAVYHNGKQKYYATGLKMDSQDVDFLKKYKAGLTGGVRDPCLRNLWHKIYGVEYVDQNTGTKKPSYILKAEKLIANLGSNFTFEEFNRQINLETKEEAVEWEGNIIADLKSKAELLKKAEKLSDGNLYESTRNSLIRFKGERILYQDATSDFLRNYEKWMLREGKVSQKEGGTPKPASVTTVGIYARNIRTVFNERIAEHLIPAESYPFGKKKYVIPAGKNIKKALLKDTIGEIINYVPTDDESLEEQSRDLWVFSYLCNGMNFADILELKWEHVDRKNNTITFVREKTSESKKANRSTVQIDLFPITWDIIKRQGNAETKKFIFPFYKETMTAIEKKKVKSNLIKNTNYNMRNIAKKLNIDMDVRTYAARHSFATILLQSEAPLAFISQKLAHSSIATTEKYLGSFEDKQVKKYLSALIPDDVKKKE